LERDVQGVHRGARSDNFRSEGLTAIAIIVASRTTLVEEVSKFRNVTNHLGITSLLSRLLGEFVPDVEPLTILLVNALTTNLDLNIVDDVVTDPVEPTELGTRTITTLELHLRESGLEVHTIDQVTITLDGASDLLTEVRGTIERVFDGLHSKVGVTSVHHFEEGNLRITS
jgi:hypothetical protein